MRQIKNTFFIALSYVGVMIGAGIASGQDILQYFVSHGFLGMLGIVLLGICNAYFGKIILVFGSFYQADNHIDVLSQIAGKWSQKIMDMTLMISCYVIGLVMIAGAGANLQQQFHIPYWIGALACSLFVLIVCFLDFEKITAVIGSITPLIAIMVIVLALTTFVNHHYDWQYLSDVAISIPSVTSSVLMAVLNYFSLCVVTGVSMAFVLGGNYYNMKVVAKGGFLGGSLVGVIMALTAFVMFAKVDVVKDANLPTQMLFADIHPFLGIVMAIVIFGMILNTAIGLFYALSKRISASRPKTFHWFNFLFVSSAFGLSFFGFKSLVGYLYPLLGYLGMFMMVVILHAWVKKKKEIIKEHRMRMKQMKIEQNS